MIERINGIEELAHKAHEAALDADFGGKPVSGEEKKEGEEDAEDEGQGSPGSPGRKRRRIWLSGWELESDTREKFIKQNDGKNDKKC